MRQKLRRIVVACTLAVARCQESKNSFGSELSAHPSFSSTATILSQYPEIVAELSQLQNITFLAPTNNAWKDYRDDPSKFEPSTDPSLVSDGDLRSLLVYHILKGTVTDLQPHTIVATALQSPKYTNVTGGAIVKYSYDANYFVSGLGVQSVVASAPFTFDGGEILAVDKLLNLPQILSRTVAAVPGTTKVTAFRDYALQSYSDTSAFQYTVFVPSNRAWLAQNTSLASLSPSQLDALVRAHILWDVVLYSTDIYTDRQWTTLQGSTLTLSLGSFSSLNQTFTLDTLRDVPLSNGVMHVIDRVLNPFDLIPEKSPVNDSASTGSDSGLDLGSGSGSGSRLSTGAKAGIGVAVPLGVIAIAVVAFLLFRRPRLRSEKHHSPALPEKDSRQKYELSGGPYDPAVWPVPGKPRLESTTDSSHITSQELASHSLRFTGSHELSSTTRTERTSKKPETALNPPSPTKGASLRKPVPLPVMPAPRAGQHKQASIDSHEDLTEEADTLVAELGVIQKRRKTLAAAASAIGLTEPGDVEGRKGDEYRKLVRREQSVRERMAEVQRAMGLGDAGACVPFQQTVN